MNAFIANTRKTIAQYSADPSNPWHAWVMDNAPEYRSFILLTQKLQRLAAESRGPGVIAGVEKFINENNLNRAQAIDAWIAYEDFKCKLTEYREAKAA